MKRAIWMAPFAVLLLAACADDGKEGVNGANGSDGLNSLVATRTIQAGDATCAGGGKILETGLDKIVAAA